MKWWYKSKTIVGMGGSLAVLGLAILALPEFQSMVDNLPVEYTGYASLFISIVTVILRYVTNEPIKIV